MYAGVYTFLCSIVLLLLLYPISNTLVQILGLPTGLSTFLLAGPVAVLGAVVWWAVVERPKKYTYRFGMVFGLLTVLATVLFWVLVFSVVWGPSLVLTGWFLIVFVLVVSIPVGFVTGVTGMYARRRLDEGLPAGEEGTPE
jgi:hypothetical protein